MFGDDRNYAGVNRQINFVYLQLGILTMFSQYRHSIWPAYDQVKESCFPLRSEAQLYALCVWPNVEQSLY